MSPFNTDTSCIVCNYMFGDEAPCKCGRKLNSKTAVKKIEELEHQVEWLDKATDENVRMIVELEAKLVDCRRYIRGLLVELEEGSDLELTQKELNALIAMCSDTVTNPVNLAEAFHNPDDQRAAKTGYALLLSVREEA